MTTLVASVIFLALLVDILHASAPTGNATTPAPTRKPWPKPNCGNPKLDNRLRNLFLDMHNRFRGNVARGQTERSAGWGIAPPATLMYRMKYDCAAESYAQQHAGSCKTGPFPAYAMPGYKENIHVLRTVQTNRVGAIQNALATWWSQLARFGMRSNMMFFPSEARRGARNVLSWSKQKFWFRWHGGTTCVLAVLSIIAVLSTLPFACTNQEGTTLTNMSTKLGLFVLDVLVANVMDKPSVDGDQPYPIHGLLLHNSTLFCLKLCFSPWDPLLTMKS
ncbi:hypothetical protein Y032_0068g258 [Ancylostoma ceylanicum]|uniref:SCP domain-containing protein n=1 Tax=Ancylostoma ceylanicum TaxID=53326 RepID=A0A016TYC5_9BILA|nr:hypothetical protein Y032_0068g258 [Ancylostoma ceylanicum]